MLRAGRLCSRQSTRRASNDLGSRGRDFHGAAREAAEDLEEAEEPLETERAPAPNPVAAVGGGPSGLGASW